MNSRLVTQEHPEWRVLETGDPKIVHGVGSWPGSGCLRILCDRKAIYGEVVYGMLAEVVTCPDCLAVLVRLRLEGS